MTSDELQFSKRNLCFSVDEQSRCIPSDEYNRLISDAEDVILLDTFCSMIKILHQWKSELELFREEDVEDDELDNSHDCDYIPLGLPHDYAREASLLLLLDLCQNKIYHATMFRSDRYVTYILTPARRISSFISQSFLGTRQQPRG